MVYLAADEAEGEELLGAVESGLGNLGGGVDGEDEGVEDGVGVGGGEAEEGRGGRVIRVGDGVEAVEGRLACGDKVGVLPPGGVLDDLVEAGAKDATGAGRAPQGLGRGHGERQKRSDRIGSRWIRIFC